MQQNKQTTEVLILELLDQKQGDFYLEGSDKDGAKPFYLKAPSWYRLPNTSVMVVSDAQGTRHEAIRYISGCEEILVSKQKELKIEPNVDSERDQIWFKNGGLVVTSDPETKAMFLFVKSSALLKGCPTAPGSAVPRFAIKEPQKEAATSNKLTAMRVDALQMVRELQVDGKDGAVYQTDRLNFLCNTFNIVAVTPEQQIQSLFAMAERLPELFLQTVASASNVYRGLIGEAIAIDVLDINGGKASLKGNGQTIFDFSSAKASNEKKINELLPYLISKDGELALRELQSHVEAAKKKMVDEVK
jgi:hypothetical protein